jgi:hypothetical protein
MENEDVIREQMDDTRTALSEKLETLENQVASSVHGATTNVAETVEAVKGTVTAVTDSVQETVTSVKESVEETIASVKESVRESWTSVKGMFDVPALVEAHPWAMLGGSIALGFFLEGVLKRPAPRREGFVGSSQRPLPPDHVSGEDRFDSSRPASTFAALLQTFEPEIKRLKGLALGKLMCTIREMVVQAVPENIATQLTEVIDGFTQKLGGDLLDEDSEKKQDHGHHRGNGRTAERAAQEV